MIESRLYERRKPAQPYRHWHDPAGYLTCARECFAAYLTLECTEVLEGDKPGDVMNLVNRTDPASCLKTVNAPESRFLQRAGVRC